MSFFVKINLDFGRRFYNEDYISLPTNTPRTQPQNRVETVRERL